MKRYGLNARALFTFPDIITQDRSQKLKDLALAQSEGWFSEERSANTAAQEFGFDDFEYETEKEKISQDLPAVAPGAGGSPLTGGSNAGLSGNERNDAKDFGNS
jgi:hypothetical protein